MDEMKGTETETGGVFSCDLATKKCRKFDAEIPPLSSHPSGKCYTQPGSCKFLCRVDHGYGKV